MTYKTKQKEDGSINELVEKEFMKELADSFMQNTFYNSCVRYIDGYTHFVYKIKKLKKGAERDSTNPKDYEEIEINLPLGSLEDYERVLTQFSYENDYQKFLYFKYIRIKQLLAKNGVKKTYNTVTDYRLQTNNLVAEEDIKINFTECMV